MTNDVSIYSNELARDLKKPLLSLRPFYHSDLINTLENIVFNQDHKNEKGVLENILSDKTKTLKATVKALLDEIKLRETLNIHLLNNIDEDICSQHTHIMQIKNHKVHYSFDMFIEIKKLILQIEDNVLELEKEKRKEYLECWRDLMFLKKYLLISLKDYWDMVKKREVLEGDFSSLWV